MAFPIDPESLPRSDGQIVIPERVAVPLTKVINQAVRAGRLPLDIRLRYGIANVDIELSVIVDGIEQMASRESSHSRTGRDHPGTLDIARERILTVSDAASRRVCSERAIQKACLSGRLPASWTGRQWLITEQDFENFTHGGNNHGALSA